MTTYQEQTMAYLRGEMSEPERTAFEDALLHSEEIRKELESSRALLDMMDAASQESIVRMVNTQIQQAIRDKASDIHIVPESGNSKGEPPRSTSVLYRIDGQLQEVMTLPGEQHRALIDRWKVMAEMNLSEQRLPQDGRIACRYQQQEFDLRVNILPTVTGERVTARILDKSRALPELHQLGMNPSTLNAVKRLVERPHGYVLIAGTTNSGKTTLSYALLRHILAVGASRPNILTVEDPVEYQIPNISQVSVNRRAGLTYPGALRSMMRSDPDVIFVGQTRDQETAELSIELAVTGHIVLSQLNVGGAVQVVSRLREMGIENHLLASNLAGAIGLRLVRKICPECAIEYAPSESDLARVGLSFVEDGPFRKGVGCAHCRQTGYRGRIGLFEVLEVNAQIRALIADRAGLDALWHEGFGRGGSLWDDARDKVRQGLVTVEDVAWALFDYPHPRHGMEPSPNLGGILDLTEF